ncbi:MAG: HEAT repeat domain-containing protein [Methylococcales bacterium]|jgi:HEAT repeat protein|nr:HEAT repeat domain-containing protein [Methylococcales bacterium]MBT7443274.1 HEAT repeat domain-containing protein [Methylococcales bacterium]
MKQYPIYPKNILLASKQAEFLAQLSNGQPNKVIKHLESHQHQLTDLIKLLESAELEMHIRLGVSAVLESFAGKAAMLSIIPQLQRLTLHTEVHLRSDACYFLGLTGQREAIAILEHALADEHEEVQTSAQEALADLTENL